MSDSHIVEQYLGSKASQSLGFDAEAGVSPRMIDLVFKSGDRIGLAYGYLVSAKLVGGNRVDLAFTDQSVTIRGRGLLPLYNHVIAQTLRRVEESTSGFDDNKTKAWVETIVVEAKR